MYSLFLNGCSVQSTKHIMEENAARFAVNIITVTSFPELLEVIGILHNLLNQKVQIIATAFIIL